MRLKLLHTPQGSVLDALQILRYGKDNWYKEVLKNTGKEQKIKKKHANTIFLQSTQCTCPWQFTNSHSSSFKNSPKITEGLHDVKCIYSMNPYC